MMIILHHFRGTAAAGDCGKRSEKFLLPLLAGMRSHEDISSSAERG